jgi:hypothetical protein
MERIPTWLKRGHSGDWKGSQQLNRGLPGGGKGFYMAKKRTRKRLERILHGLKEIMYEAGKDPYVAK